MIKIVLHHTSDLFPKVDSRYWFVRTQGQNQHFIFDIFYDCTIAQGDSVPELKEFVKACQQGKTSLARLHIDHLTQKINDLYQLVNDQHNFIDGVTVHHNLAIPEDLFSRYYKLVPVSLRS